MMPHLPTTPPIPNLKIMAAIPCFNTETSIVAIVTSAKKYAAQVLVVDDGSLDGTAKAAEAAGATVIRHETNKGYGEAIKTGFKAAKSNGADILVTIDGDGQHNPEEIPVLLAPILKGEAQVVIGSRFLDNGVNIPGYRRLGINIITWLFNIGSKTRVTDAQSGFRAYQKEIIDTYSLSENGMSISIEILEKTRSRGATIKEVPISCLYIRRTIDIKAIRHGVGVAFSVIKIRLKPRGEGTG